MNAEEQQLVKRIHESLVAHVGRITKLWSTANARTGDKESAYYLNEATIHLERTAAALEPLIKDVPR
jgi:hypothetical protein